MLRLASTSFALSVVLLTCIASAEQPANKAVLSHTRYNGALKGARHSALSFDNGLLALPMPSSVDDWLGGFGLWSNADNWDNGVPDGTSDVTIYSGGNDIVTLDVRAAINSLTLGG